MRKARAWFLKVTLANTARAPLGPCTRCGEIELNTVVRAGARMCTVYSYSAELIDMEEEDQVPLRPRRPRRKANTRDLLTSVETSPDQSPGDCVTFQPRKGGVRETDSRERVTGVTWRDSQPSTPAAAGQVVSPVGASQGVPTGEVQEAMTVLGRSREAQQRVRQSRMAGGRDAGEGTQVTWPPLSSTSPVREGQLFDTKESREEKSRADITQGEGPEEDGTPSPSRLAQGSRRVTFTLWAEDTGTEVDEGLTKYRHSSRSLQGQVKVGTSPGEKWRIFSARDGCGLKA